VVHYYRDEALLPSLGINYESDTCSVIRASVPFTGHSTFNYCNKVHVRFVELSLYYLVKLTLWCEGYEVLRVGSFSYYNAYECLFLLLNWNLGLT
jgi:hypothetical protein